MLVYPIKPQVDVPTMRKIGPNSGALRRSSACATLVMMKTVGLRELRQDASDLVRAVEQGEEIEVTVAGRRAARLVPAKSSTWQSWRAIAHLFNGPSDTDWELDRDKVDQSLSNPWDVER
jgi:prevent-host-death family protein